MGRVRVFAVLSLLALLIVACQEKRRPVVYEIPEGYRGWVELEFGRQDCPQLQVRDEKYLVRFSEKGKACTSSSPEYGIANDEFYLVKGDSRKAAAETGWGGGGLIWAGSIGTESYPGRKVKSRERFFVGTEAEFNAAEEAAAQGHDTPVSPSNAERNR